MIKWLKKEINDLMLGFDKMSGKQWQILFLSFVGMLLVSGGFLFFVPSIQQHVRASQVESVVFHGGDESKVKILPYGKLEEKVALNKKCVVLFVPKNSPFHDEILEMLQDEKVNKELKGPIYLYPFVYDEPADLKNFRLDSTHAAVISYKKDLQLARKTIKTKEDLQNLVTEINKII